MIDGSVHFFWISESIYFKCIPRNNEQCKPINIDFAFIGILLMLDINMHYLKYAAWFDRIFKRWFLWLFIFFWFIVSFRFFIYFAHLLACKWFIRNKNVVVKKKKTLHIKMNLFSSLNITSFNGIRLCVVVFLGCSSYTLKWKCMLIFLKCLLVMGLHKETTMFRFFLLSKLHHFHHLLTNA